ncbi:unnamed protein product [Cutaneotrichosporon oleaginosum]
MRSVHEPDFNPPPLLAVWPSRSSNRHLTNQSSSSAHSPVSASTLAHARTPTPTSTRLPALTHSLSPPPRCPTMDTPNGHVPPEIEATLSRLSAYRNVRGVMILARGAGCGIVQSSGAVFEGDSGRRYAGALEGVVAATAGAVGAVDEGVGARFDPADDRTSCASCASGRSGTS